MSKEAGKNSERGGEILEQPEALQFPTVPAFLVPVEVRDLPDMGKGHRGVFSTADIACGTKIWAWTDRVKRIHHSELEAFIVKEFGEEGQDEQRLANVQLFLRQGFVLPNESDIDYFNSNPTDAGRFIETPACVERSQQRDENELIDMATADLAARLATRLMPAVS